MNAAFSAYIATARTLASDRGISWDIAVDQDGTINKQIAWNLTALAGVPPPPVIWLADLGSDKRTLVALNTRLVEMDRQPVTKTALLPGWQDLIKAATIQNLLVSQNNPAGVLSQVSRPLKVLGTCVQALSGAEPWAMTLDDARFAWTVAASVQASGKLGELVESVVKCILDIKHLCDNGPFYQLLTGQRSGQTQPRKQGRIIRKNLHERKSEDRLPELRAFWELVRIVFTEPPRSISDALRFAQIKLLILCGLRIGEVCSIPLDWKRVRDYVDLDGKPAGLVGGISRSLMLRHFAEKQRGWDENSVLLYEAVQHIPGQFEQIIEETLDAVAALTEPLRMRMRRQIHTNRIFPEFKEEALVPLTDFYPRLTGNPILRPTPRVDELTDLYRNGFSVPALERIIEDQANRHGRFYEAFYLYWIRLQETGGPPLRFADGRAHHGTKYGLDRLCLRVDEVETYIRQNLPTKLTDTAPFLLGDGTTLPPDQLLFLMPKRALSETRNDGVCDMTRYFAIGRATPDDLRFHLSSGKGHIFARYGKTEEDRGLGLNSHSLRHLQNTELFRLGIADTIITKRFNRRSVAQSYEYDHRSLAEDLAAIDLPSAAQKLPEKAQSVAAMIAAGKASGPIVDEFKRIQNEQGDERAFEFLSAEADGFHATPYGHCINSFTVDPCPKHLQCFDGCTHLVATQIDSQRVNLEKTRARLLVAIDEIEGRQGGIGRENQLMHAKRLVENIEKLLESREGERPFADGKDFSQSISYRRTPLDANS